MKIFNIILSIFIFLFAAASAVFSYFLFEKRAQFVSGHEKMARTIYESSKVLDAGSGTDEARKLNNEALAHDKYDSLDTLLKVLPQQSKAVIAQRDGLAEKMWRIGQAVKMSNLGDVEKFKVIDGADDRLNAVVRSVANTVTRRDNTYAEISAISGKYSVRLNPRDLVNAASRLDSRKVLQPLDRYINTTRSNSNAYRNALVELSRLAGKQVQVTDAKRDAGIANVKAQVVKKINEVKKLGNDLRNAKRQYEQLKVVAANHKKNAEKSEAARKNVANALSELKKSIGVAQDYVPWRAGSEDALARLYGKVIGVSDEYGYVVIDLGENSVVYQKSSNGKRVPISLKLKSGTELMIIRATTENIDPKAWYAADGAVINSAELASKDEFIASTSIVKVGEKESVVELPAGAKVKVGDVVLYKSAAK